MRSVIMEATGTQFTVAQVRSYDGDINLLGATEKFFLALADVPNIENRVDVWLFQQSYDELYHEVERVPVQYWARP